MSLMYLWRPIDYRKNSFDLFPCLSKNHLVFTVMHMVVLPLEVHCCKQIFVCFHKVINKPMFSVIIIIIH